MNFNYETIEQDNKVFVFVTRGRAKPISSAEVKMFLDEYSNEKPDEPEETFVIPDDRQRKVMFTKDLRMGIDFCAKKYGVSKSAIVAEAQRLVPHIRWRET